jgi:hypothetical protein
MKQRITLTRTETVVVELDYKVDPHTRANTEFWANQGYCGTSPIGRVGQPAPISQVVTDWRVAQSTPALSPCAQDILPKTKSRRRT